MGCDSSANATFSSERVMLGTLEVGDSIVAVTMFN